MDELTREEVEAEARALAIYQALFKVVGSVVATKNPDNLRGFLDSYLLDSFEKTGVVGKIQICDDDGNQLGLLSAKTTTPSTRFVMHVTDPNMVMRENEDLFGDFIEDNIDLFAKWLHEQGIDSYGIEVEKVKTTGGKWNGTVLTGCDPEKVLPALAPQLVQGMSTLGLLPAGEVE